MYEDVTSFYLIKNHVENIPLAGIDLIKHCKICRQSFSYFS